MRRGALERDRLPIVVRLIGVRHPDDALCVPASFLYRDYGAIGNDVVHEVSPGRPGITQVVHLDRCWTQREDLASAATRVALEIDEDVDTVPSNTPGGRVERFVADVDEAIERGHEPAPTLAAVVGTERVGDDLEAAAVVTLEQPGGEMRGGMVVEVRGSSSRCGAGRRGAAPARRERRRRGRPFADSRRVAARDVEPQRRRHAHDDRVEGAASRPAMVRRDRSATPQRARRFALPPRSSRRGRAAVAP